MIRKYKDNDLEAVLDIWLRANIEAHSFIAAEYWEGNFDYVREVIPLSEVYVYVLSGKVVAFIGIDGGHIAGLFVDAQYRANGIGHEIISFVKSKYNKLTLCVYSKNKAACRFYHREGFVNEKESIDDATGEMEFIMKWESEQ